jgi:hypothetical protein
VNYREAYGMFAANRFHEAKVSGVKNVRGVGHRHAAAGTSTILRMPASI